MCGIAGFSNIASAIQLEVMKNLEIRGRDGFGLATWNRLGQMGVMHTLDTPTKFFQERKRDVKGWIVLANTRAVPTTEFQKGAGAGLISQQPFTSGRFIWVFNGLIANDRVLNDKYDLDVNECMVDTAILGPLFEKLGVVEGMRELEGAYAIICFDKINNTLYFGKNFLPMVMQIDNEARSLIVTSLKEMLPEDLQNEAREVPVYTCFEYLPATHELFQHSLYKKERNKKALVIFSSGIDSVVTAWLYKYLGYDLTLLHFTYGQAAQEVELFAAKALAEKLDAKLMVYDAQPLFAPFKDTSRLLCHNKSSDKEQELDAEGTMSYVPNRNGIFAMVAAALAEKEGCDTVSYGGQQMSASYPDNNVGFANAIDNTIKHSLNWHTNIKFTAPFIHLIKHEIVWLGLTLGVPYDLVCSCYFPKLKDGKVVVCGRCGCCQFRFSSFKMLKVKDTQEYESLPTWDWFDGLKDKLEYTQAEVNNFIEKYVRNYV